MYNLHKKVLFIDVLSKNVIIWIVIKFLLMFNNQNQINNDIKNSGIFGIPLYPTTTKGLILELLMDIDKLIKLSWLFQTLMDIDKPTRQFSNLFHFNINRIYSQ
jgi:hypothetical protein